MGRQKGKEKARAPLRDKIIWVGVGCFMFLASLIGVETSAAKHQNRLDVMISGIDLDSHELSIAARGKASPQEISWTEKTLFEVNGTAADPAALSFPIEAVILIRKSLLFSDTAISVKIVKE